MKSIARWEGTRPPGASEWKPMDFEVACKILANDLRRNLDHWTRSYPEIRPGYEEALLALDVANVQVYPSGLVIQLRDHTLSITPEIHGALGKR